MLLKKKGNSEDLINYRPITLLTHIHKTFIRLIPNRLTNDLSILTSREHTEFCNGCSTIDHIQSMRQLSEKCRFRILCLAFMGYKALDSVKTVAVFIALDKFAISPENVDLQEGMNSGCTSESSCSMTTLVLHPQRCNLRRYKFTEVIHCSIKDPLQ